MKYLILGAGPAGLTFANRLKQAGETSFLVLEREEEAGGLCRSAEVDGAPFDIGGGHFLDVRDSQVNQFLFDFMPLEEWNLYTRDSRILMGETLVGHPLEDNIWQLGIEDQVEYLKSVALAGSNTGAKMPEKFMDWIHWKLGSKIAEEYMLPYNRKMFGKELNWLGTYWLKKLPDVSFEEILLSCLKRRAYGKQPGHAQFYYPKNYGYGELWIRMANSIQGHIAYHNAVKKIDFDKKEIETENKEKYRADHIITTIPWMEFEEVTGMPYEIACSIEELRFTSIQTAYHPEKLNTDAHWIYCPGEEYLYHRILVRHNFCPSSKGYWTETNTEWIDTDMAEDNFKYTNQYAYPLNTIGKPEIMERLLSWSRKKGVYGLGRWGEHQHYNSDVTVRLSMELADKFAE